MSSVQQIDFKKYRTPELAEKVSEILAPTAVLWQIVKWTLLWMFALSLIGGLLFWGRTHWGFYTPAALFALCFGFSSGVMFGFARAIKSAIDRIAQLFELLLNVVSQVFTDCREIREGTQVIPKRADLIRAVYSQVFAPTIEKVVANKLGLLGKPVIWGYKLTLGKVVNVFIKRSSDDLEPEQLETLDSITENLEKAAHTVSEKEQVITGHVASSQSQIGAVSSAIKFGCSAPLYLIFGFFFLFGLLALVVLRVGASPVEREFKPTTESQRVIFYTKNWDGAGGDPLLKTSGSGRSEQVDGLPVLLKSAAQDLIKKDLGPLPKQNTDGTIRVEAMIHLEKDSATVTSDPPSQREIYSVVIDKLIRAEWDKK